MTAGRTDAVFSPLQTTPCLLPLFETVLGDEEACIADPLYIGLFQMSTQTSSGKKVKQ